MLFDVILDLKMYGMVWNFVVKICIFYNFKKIILVLYKCK